MSDTVLEHPVVREYLRELDKASLTLPAAQARELREQIAAHLDEALPPTAAPEQVRDEIGRLGSPRSLAAAAAGPASRSLAARLLPVRAADRPRRDLHPDGGRTALGLVRTVRYQGVGPVPLAGPSL